MSSNSVRHWIQRFFQGKVQRRPITSRPFTWRTKRIVAELLEDRSTPAANPLGPQFLVSEVTGLEAGPPAVAIVNNAGDFIATWESLETDGSGIGVFAQRFQANGTPVDTPVQVATALQGNQARPAIASDGNGNVVIAWQGEAPSGGAYDIYYKTGDFTAVGDWLSPNDLLVNVETTGSQTKPTVTMDENGQFVIAWQSDQTIGTTGFDIYARFGTLTAGLSGLADVAVAIGTGDEKAPDASMADTSAGVGDQSGNMIISWTGPGPVGTEGEATNVVRGTLYGYDTTYTNIAPVDVAHTDYQLTAEVQHDQVEPDVAMSSSGRFVLAWQAEGGTGTGSDLFSRRFNAAGNGLDAVNVPVNTTTTEPQRYPAVGVDANDDYFIAWQTQGQDGRSWGVVGRAFNEDGTALRPEFIVNINVQGPQTNPAVSVAPNGSVVAIWTGPYVPTHGGPGEEEGVEGEGGHQPSVFGRLFANTGVADVSPAATAQDVNGLEFRVAAVGAGEDVPAAAVACTDGNYVVVWQAFEETLDGSGFGVYGQRVAPDGTLLGAKFLVNETTVGYQSHPGVAALANGGFVVVWQAEIRNSDPTLASQYDILARIFTVDGTGTLVLGSEFLVNENTIAGAQTHPVVASNSADTFVAAWQTDALAADEYGTEIYARRYSVAGTTATNLGVETRVNEFTAGTTTPTVTGQDQVTPVVAMNAAGAYAIAWVSDHNIGADPGDTEKSIFVRTFDATGVAANPEFLANTYTKDAQEHPAIAIDTHGNVVVVWQSINQEIGGSGVSWGVFGRQFRPDGTSPQSQEFHVNQTTAAPQRLASVAIDPLGNFTVAWQSINQDGSSWGVFRRQYKPDATPETGEILVNTHTGGPQILPIFAMKANGDYAIFWSGQGPGHLDGVWGQNFEYQNAPPINSVPGDQVVMPGGSYLISLGFSIPNGNAIQVSDPDIGSGDIRVNLATTGGTLVVAIAYPGVTFTGYNSNNLTLTGNIAAVNKTLNTLFYLPGTFTGDAVLTVTSDDLGSTGGGGPQTDVDTVNIRVAPHPNAAPVNHVPGPQSVVVGTPLAFNDANGNSIRVGDIDSGFAPIQVTMQVSHGKLNIVAPNNASFQTTGVNTNTLVLTGRADYINYYLQSLTYTPGLSFPGSDALVMLTNDQGNIGTGGPKTDVDTVVFTGVALPENQPPENSVPDAQVALAGEALMLNLGNFNLIQVSDPDAGTLPVQVNLTVTAGTLVYAIAYPGVTAAGYGTNSLTLTGPISAINKQLGTLIFRAPPTPGAATLTVTTNDLENYGSGGAKIDVDTVAISVVDPATHVNVGPTVIVPATTQAVAVDGLLRFNDANANGIRVGDIDAGYDDVVVTLTVTHGTLSVTPLAGAYPAVPTVTGAGTTQIVLTGRIDHINYILQSLAYTPDAGYTGADVLTVLVNDLGHHGTGGPLTITDTVNIAVGP